MVRPAALYNKARFSRDFASLGRVVAALCGNARISRGDLTDAEMSALEELENENEEMDKNAERERKRKADYRAARAREMSHGQSGRAECPTDKTDGAERAADISDGQNVPGTIRSSSTTVQPTVQPYNQPTVQPTVQPTTNRSVTVTVPLRPEAKNGTERNVNGTGDVVVRGGADEARRLAAVAARELNGADGDQAFFSGEHDAVSLILALTGDYGSVKRWRQLVRTKGEAAVCEELFRFYREIRSGEDCKNRAAALNRRLAALPAAAEGGDADETPPDAREAASTRSGQSGRGMTPPAPADAPGAGKSAYGEEA